MKKRNMCRWDALVVSVLLVGSPLHALCQDRSSLIEELVGQYHELRQFNGAVLVGQHGNVIYEGGFGYANMDWQIPNTPDTKFRIGSVTKQFTAAVILNLAEQGKLDLEGTITDYLPDYPSDVGGKVTIHQLLTHSSGIPSYTGLPDFDEMARDRYAPDSFITVFSELDLEFEPGSAFRYNNSGYFLLGVIIERVTGTSYEEALRTMVLDPLGLDETGYDHHERIIDGRATGYSKRLTGYDVAAYLDMSLPYAAGSMYSTVRDLHKWDRLLYSDSVFGNSASKELMFTPYIQDYAYGWIVRDIPVGPDSSMVKLVGHGGGINGFVTGFWRLVDDGYVVIVMDNTAGDRVADIQRGIVDILYGEIPATPRRSIAEALLGIVEERGLDAGVSQYREFKESRPDDFDFRESELNSLGYHYLNMGDTEASIAMFKLNVEAYPDAYNTYDSLGEAYLAAGDSVRAIENYVKSVELNPRNENGRTVLARLGVESDEGGGEAIAVPVEVLERYVGEYQLGGELRIAITIENGQLMGQATGQGKYELAAVSETQFTIEAVNVRITFVVEDDGAVAGFNLSRGGQTLFAKKIG
ncbi:MAG: serine hydrolase [Gemmatimonadota bacterium]|nr:MAG: serine hydrolase [Gemmatimonadota bacterium]